MARTISRASVLVAGTDFWDVETFVTNITDSVDARELVGRGGGQKSDGLVSDITVDYRCSVATILPPTAQCAAMVQGNGRTGRNI